MIFGVRHGERADFISKKSPEYKAIQISYDPHLSSKGVEQGCETGRFIQKKIDEYAATLPLDEEGKECQLQAIIVTSPFLRTIMTSYAIAKQLKNEDICEYLATHDYNNFPLDTLFCKMRTNELSSYVDQSTFKLAWNFFKPTKRPRFPENAPKADKRIAAGMELMKQKYFSEFDPHKYSSMLTFESGEVAEKCDFCAILQVHYPEANYKNYEKQKVLIKGSNDQIKHLL